MNPNQASAQSIGPLWLNRRRFVRAIQSFAGSQVGGRAKALFAVLIAFMFAINGLNVLNSYVGRDFMTAIERRSMESFVNEALLYLAVFAASTTVAVLYRYTEERLALLWREWLSRRLVTTYMHGQTYYRLRETGEADNPDQRMAEDARAFTATTLSFTLMVLNGTFTILAFSGVMWSISPLLFAVAVGYAALGSLLTIALGRPLMWLNYNQSDKEAEFRAELIHVRENAESIAVQRRENRLLARLHRRIDDLAANTKRMIAVNRNLGFFTTGYNFLIQIIPALIIAPMFMRGEVQFGVITQSSMAFAHLLGAFSLIVTQFQSISSYAAVLSRLTALGEATEKREKSAIEIRDGDSFAYDRLTLRSPRDGRTLVRELSLAIPDGWKLLITGPNETAKVALFRATAGMWQWGDGRIVRPDHDGLLFLPERPYLPPGSLREILVRKGNPEAVSEELIRETLRLLDVEVVATRAGGLDTERDWDNILALGEQQLLAVAALVLAGPRFVFLDRVATAFTIAQLDRALSVLSEKAITYAVIGERGVLEHRYDAVLELAGDGSWTCEPLQLNSAAVHRG